MESGLVFLAGEKKNNQESFYIHFQLYVRKIKNTLRHTVTQRDMEEVPCQYKSDLQPPKAVSEKRAVLYQLGSGLRTSA